MTASQEDTHTRDGLTRRHTRCVRTLRGLQVKASQEDTHGVCKP